MKRYIFKLTDKQLRIITQGLSWYEGCGFPDEEKYALELRVKLLKEANRQNLERK